MAWLDFLGLGLGEGESFPGQAEGKGGGDKLTAAAAMSLGTLATGHALNVGIWEGGRKAERLPIGRCRRRRLLGYAEIQVI